MMEWCVRSWDEIRTVHRSMKNGSRVADGLYIKRVLLALEDFLFFSLYSFSCIAKQVTTLKQLRFLSCLDFLETNLEPLAPLSAQTLLLPISPTPDPARYMDSRWSMGLEVEIWRWDYFSMFSCFALLFFSFLDLGPV